MSFKDEQLAIEQHFQDNFQELPVVNTNRPYSPEPGQNFVTCEILNGEGFHVSLGENPRRRYTGVIQNKIFVDTKQGEGEARRVADLIGAIWENKQFYLNGSGVITCRVPSYTRLGLERGFFVAVVSTPYQRNK